MIANANWFNRRKYTGWGVTPKTWQGFLYTAVVVGMYVVISNFLTEATIKMFFVGFWTLLIVIDMLQLMASIQTDEREQKIEAIAGRNASWALVAALGLSALFVTTIGKELKGENLLPAFIFPIIIGAVAKGLSNFILERREL